MPNNREVIGPPMVRSLDHRMVHECSHRRRNCCESFYGIHWAKAINMIEHEYYCFICNISFKDRKGITNHCGTTHKVCNFTVYKRFLIIISKKSPIFKKTGRNAAHYNNIYLVVRRRNLNRFCDFYVRIAFLLVIILG